MAMDIVIFVSKRLQRAAGAVLCLTALQMILVLASCQAEIAPAAARVHIQR